MNKLTPEQLVSNLYNASRLAALTSEQHEILRANAEELLAFLKEPCDCKTTEAVKE